MYFCHYCGAELEMPGTECLMCGELDVRVSVGKLEKRPPLSKFEDRSPYVSMGSGPADDVLVLSCPILTEPIDLTYTKKLALVRLGPTTLVSLSHYLGPRDRIKSLLEDENDWLYQCIWAFKNGYPDHVGIWCQIAASVLKRISLKNSLKVDFIVRALGSGELVLKGDEQEPLDLLARAMCGSGLLGPTVYAPGAVCKKHLMPQTKTMKRNERIQQIIEGEIYACDASKLLGSNKTILVVDDVCTSGSTLFGIREAILKVKSDATVIFLVVANNPGTATDLELRGCHEQNATVGRCFGTLMPDKILSNLTLGVHKIAIDKEAPKALQRLAQIKDAPKVVYCMGNLDLLKSVKNVAVVGSRSCTVIGKKNAKAVAKYLAKSGYCVVSGLADGIDTAAHLGALVVSDMTIAVVPSLTDLNDPILACEILKRGGLLLSENPPNTKVTAELLVSRNRLQTGLSLATFVIEAEDKSGGTMATAEFSLLQKRPILCPDFSLYSSSALELAGLDKGDIADATSGILALAQKKVVAMFFTLDGLGSVVELLVKLHD